MHGATDGEDRAPEGAGAGAPAREAASPGDGTKAPQPRRDAPAGQAQGEGGQPAPDWQKLFQQLVERANQGEKLARTRLRRFLDLNPWIWQWAGDLTAIAERTWIDRIAGPERLVAESVQRRLAQLKGELKGPQPTPLESLLADQVALAWLAARDADIQAAAAAGESLDQEAFRLRRAESAQKRLVNGVKALATLRALGPQGRVPAGRPRLFEPGRQWA